MSNVFNAFTKDCDKYLLPTWQQVLADGYSEGTYFCCEAEDRVREVAVFRFPGATRGHVALDPDGVILSIDFYNTCFSAGVGVYDRKIVPDMTAAWVGKKLPALDCVEEKIHVG